MRGDGVALLEWAFGLLVAAGSIGAFLATRHLIGRPPPLGVAMTHGPLAIIALGLILASLFAGEFTAERVVASILIGLNTLFGIMMFLGHRRGVSPPRALLALHASIGGIILFLVGRAAALW